MRKIAGHMTLSLDGYFQGPDHDLSWHLVDEELHAHFNEQLANNGASIAGRVSGSEDGSIRAAILAGAVPRSTRGRCGARDQGWS